MKEHTDQIGLEKEDATTARSDIMVFTNFEKHEVNPASCVKADKTGLKKVVLKSLWY